MSRPVGVTVSAVILILGSLSAALIGFFMLFTRSFARPPTPEPPYYGAMMAFASVMYFGFAFWDVLTAVGLFRMRRWARISILVIGALLMIFCSLSLVMILVVARQMPEFESIDSAGAVMGVMFGVFLVPILLGLFWLVYFNRTAVKAKFLEGFVPDELPHRPLSITVIAWHAVAFGVLVIPFALSNLTALMFGVLFTGWAAKLTYLIIGVTQLAIGIGLLKLRPWSHTAAVWYCIIVMVHGVVLAFLPNKAARIAEIMKYHSPEIRTEFPVSLEPFFWIFAVFTIATFGTVLWYLITRRKAFLEAGKAIRPIT